MFLRTKLIALILFSMLFAACAKEAVQVISEEDETHFRRGEQLLKEGRQKEALEAFIKVIEKRRDAAESHLRTGELCLTYLKDPVQAIYHYRKFLELIPDSEDKKSEVVRQRIETAKKEFLQNLPMRPYADETERLDLLDMIEQMKGENLRLKQQLAEAHEMISIAERLAEEVRLDAQAFIPAGGGSEAPAEVEAQSNNMETELAIYKVQKGDTLSSISDKVYGTPNRWKAIFDANRDVLPSAHSLKLGQELKIP